MTYVDYETEERAAWSAVETIGAEARDENACGARRLFAIGQLYQVRAPDDDTEKLCWAIDGHTSLVAEVATALALSRGRAAAQVRMAIALFTKLPRVLHTAKSGLLDYRMLAAIVARTELIIDPDILARVDERLAERALTWVRLSEPKIEARINAIIAAQDPDAVRIREQIRRDRHVGIAPNGEGAYELWGTIDTTAAASMHAILTTMADSVCPGDPRTHDQRRADAFAAVFAGHGLICQCGQPDCCAEPVPAPGGIPRAKLIVHIIADAAHTMAVVPGYGQIGADALAAATAHATGSHVDPSTIKAEKGRFPSDKLAEYIRCRDMTCRFPGCDVPAWDTDIDHTVPWPAGPTHPSNLKCLCRAHHLLKTFFEGWNDTQLANGTVVWSSPTGHVYTTEPEGGHWFGLGERSDGEISALGNPTGEPTLQPSPAQQSNRCLSMPTRDRSRTDDRIRRTTTERAANHARIEQQEHNHQAWLAANYEPPPF